VVVAKAVAARSGEPSWLAAIDFTSLHNHCARCYLAAVKTHASTAGRQLRDELLPAVPDKMLRCKCCRQCAGQRTLQCWRLSTAGGRAVCLAAPLQSDRTARRCRTCSSPVSTGYTGPLSVTLVTPPHPLRGGGVGWGGVGWGGVGWGVGWDEGGWGCARGGVHGSVPPERQPPPHPAPPTHTTHARTHATARPPARPWPRPRPMPTSRGQRCSERTVASGTAPPAAR
jgi:hypothetical protein